MASYVIEVVGLCTVCRMSAMITKKCVIRNDDALFLFQIRKSDKALENVTQL